MLPKNRPPTHPGEMLLKEFLEPSGITQLALARHLGWTYARLNEIINGRRGITADSALALGDALGTGPEFWLNLQRDWNLWHSMRIHKRIPKLKKVVSQHEKRIGV
jgi:addiction module HigA family antidote